MDFPLGLVNHAASRSTLLHFGGGARAHPPSVAPEPAVESRTLPLGFLFALVKAGSPFDGDMDWQRDLTWHRWSWPIFS